MPLQCERWAFALHAYVLSIFRTLEQGGAYQILAIESVHRASRQVVMAFRGHLYSLHFSILVDYSVPAKLKHRTGKRFN